MRLTDALLSPNGRLNRAGFWGGYIALSIVTAVAAYSLLSLAERMGGEGPLSDAALRPWLVALVLLVPVTWISFCLAVKRWHDRGKSGLWVLIAFIPYIGSLWVLIECGCLRGTIGANAYGPDPLA